MLGAGLAEVDGWVVGLVGVEDGVGLASEAGYELLVYEFHHRVEGDLALERYTSLGVPLDQQMYMKFSLRKT